MEIQPEKQNIDQTFSTTVYFIDFYQRDYKWTSEPVTRLLDDVFYQFDEVYDKHADLEPKKENINARYPWYYLNTYVTNSIDGRVFVVDGQQRLTTITLILLKLLSKAKTLNSKTTGWLERKIAGYSGSELEFWMNHVRHKQVFEGLMAGVDPSTIDQSTGVTAANMIKNYNTISDRLDESLTSQHRFETFVHYFLLRLVLINLAVDSKHVPMVFEVINDRGVRLKPYEILKGKLLGQIDKVELDKGNYNELWENCLKSVNKFKDDEIDNFFRYWLKAKFSNARKDGQRFDGDYHREMFKSDINAQLKLDHNPIEVKVFLKDTFQYFSNLYAKLWAMSKGENDSAPAVYFNSLNELDSQYMLALSACKVHDPEESLKLKLVSEGIDRLFTLLQLQGAYDSNEFAILLFTISAEIREQPASIIPETFDKHLLLQLSEKRAVQVQAAFNYNLFKPISIDRLNTRFTRYIFGRVEMLLAEGMRLKIKLPLKELVTSRGAKTGFHVEHILSRNDENYALFDHDEEKFEQERNRLGGVLLLKGKDNISSNNEIFAKKLKSYANTLYWNETLREDTYQSKLDFRAFIKAHALNFKHYEQFGPVELEERHKLLFELISLIWVAKQA
jgi:uncharacterized protein with ParB-like and HNH nuclease domain